MLAQARPRSFDEREQVPMSLDFFRPGRNPILTVRILEPSTGSEDFAVLTPECGGAIHAFHRNSHKSAFSDREVVNQLTGCRGDGLGEWDDVIFRRLCGCIS